MSMYDKSHYNIVISIQIIKINEKKKDEGKWQEHEQNGKSKSFPISNYFV